MEADKQKQASVKMYKHKAKLNTSVVSLLFAVFKIP